MRTRQQFSGEYELWNLVVDLVTAKKYGCPLEGFISDIEEFHDQTQGKDHGMPFLDKDL